MTSILEITGEDISRLNQTEFRSLIGLLCEADYRQAGLPTKGIDWSGDQNAGDGGIDVHVDCGVLPPATSFVSRAKTGFQVKAASLPAAKVAEEMRPKGLLRAAIKELLAAGGAYIIVSNESTAYGTMLKDRLTAMRAAVASEAGNENLHVDFYDRGKIASWVRLHPSYAVWARERIGRPLAGWKSFGNWSNAPQEDEYLLDAQLRLHSPHDSRDDGESVAVGIERIRAALAVPGSAVRLTGLSGVGKTRLAQALFDKRVGAIALNPHGVLYTELGRNPQPDPVTLAEQFAAESHRLILVVDNCGAEDHRRLSAACKGTSLSVLTIEHDVRDDLPPETEVFKLEPASDSLIEQLLAKRRPELDQLNIRRMAEFAGGNARLALALASTVEAGESLSGLRDQVLFERLFHQSHEHDNSILKSAEALSLVYSFQGEDTSSPDSELRILGSLIDKSELELFRDAKFLRDRNLIQARAEWRAVLPHALANWLAAEALKSIPPEVLTHSFLTSGNQRLIQSFSRRLGYLHNSDEAVSIVRRWLAPDGWLGQHVHSLNSFGMSVFENVAPVAPAETVGTIEVAARTHGDSLINPSGYNRMRMVWLLCHLAYEEELFPRCIALLLKFALADESRDKEQVWNRMGDMFFIKWSGTNAPLNMRAKIVEQLVFSDKHTEQDLGLRLLTAALTTWRGRGFQETDFGARLRGSHYSPKSQQDVIDWFTHFIGICSRIATSNSRLRDAVRGVLANNLRALWHNCRMFDYLMRIATIINQDEHWGEGWIAAKEILHFDRDAFDEETRTESELLEASLRPSDLLSRARIFAFLDARGTVDLLDEKPSAPDDSTGWKKLYDETRLIGAQVAADPKVLDQLLADLVSNNNMRLYAFGEGLAAGTDDRPKLLNRLIAAFKAAPENKRDLGTISGFLSWCATLDPELYSASMDGLVTDETVGTWFPSLQLHTQVDEIGIQRLHRSLDNGKPNPWAFQSLSWPNRKGAINDTVLAQLIRSVARLPNGRCVSEQILQARMPDTNESSPASQDLTEVGREILADCTFDDSRRDRGDHDYALSIIAKNCLVGEEGRELARTLCKRLVSRVNEYQAFAPHYSYFVQSLAKTQPVVFLDEFVGTGRGMSHEFHQGNPLRLIPDAEIVEWCDAEPETRYVKIAGNIDTVMKAGDEGGLAWRPIVHRLLEKSPNIPNTLAALAHATLTTHVVSSWSHFYSSHLSLFEQLADDPRPEVRDWSKQKVVELTEWIAEARRREVNEARGRQRFE